MPSLNCSGQSHLVSVQASVGLIVVGDIGQETLLGLSLECHEVELEVVGEGDTVIILIVLIQLGEDLGEGVLFLSIFN